MAVRLPTRTRDWRLMARTGRLVLTIPAYAVLALVAGLLSLALFSLSQNYRLVLDLVIGGSLPPENRLNILLGLFPFLGTSFSFEAEVLLTLIALLAGIDVALVVYHFREHRVSLSQGGGSALGVTLGLLGAGCAACGSVVLAGLFSLLGVAGALTLLPFEGLEFSVLALLALVLSIYWMADGMRGGEINGCPVD